MVSLSEIYTYGKIDLDYWDKIFKSIKITIKNMHLCALHLETSNNLKITDHQLNSDDSQLFQFKTIERLRKEDSELNINIDSLKNKILYNKENEV